jgi:ABC-2 type transport system permease protein
MKRVFNMALKDLRLLSRDKMGAFFIFGFPILMGLFFGLMMGGGGSGGSGKMKIAIVDQDGSEISQKFVDSLVANDSLIVQTDEMEPAKESIRKGNRIAMLVLPKGFGETAGVFWEEPPVIKLGVDPSRQAESAMLQGLVMQSMGELIGTRFQDTSMMRNSIGRQREELAANEDLNPANKLLVGALFGSLESMFDSMEAINAEEPGEGNVETGGVGAPGFNFAEIESLDISRKVDPNSVGGQLQKVRSQWDISFPQAMMWGVLGCAAGFAISIAKERTEGTMVRLQVAPVTRFEVLAGKALACFMVVVMVIAMLTGLGMALGMRPGNMGLLVLAAICVSFCFVGIMMTMSVLGKTEQAVSGAGWAINMVMAMLGGCMIPVMFMPAVIQKFSVVSPIKWGILAIEGAIWRDFSLQEMLFPCGVLLAVGTLGLVVGTLILQRSDA